MPDAGQRARGKVRLKRYAQKRDFGKTAEPGPGGETGQSGKTRARRPAAARTRQLIFVVQKHAARRLHWDFRLEWNGTLRSWAVPKGPSLDPADKRLAVEVEDHPISYAKFAGDIPKGQYGGGHVDIWDNGTWEPVGDFAKQLAKGHLEFLLRGRKLNGRWHLVRTRMQGKQPQWLLMKSNDDAARTGADADVIDAGQSARIRELVRLVEGSDVGELTVEDGPLRITVRKQDERPPAPIFMPTAGGPAPVNGETHEPEVSSSIRLESPMVGTFYRSPSPAQPAFVAEGDRVEVGQTLCILEAMKLFNEYKSDHAGIIRRILVENAQPVEYGQPLFELEPV